MRFRPAITPLFLFLFVLVTPGSVIPTGLYYGWEGVRSAVPIALITGLILSLLGAFFFCVAFPQEISTMGVAGHSVWGFKRFIEWGQISQARPIRILNLRWLRLYSSANGKVTYLALFLADWESVREEVRREAPADCPIHTYL